MDERKTTRAAMVVIGNEILSGKIVDSNSGFLAREMRRMGVSLERIVVIPDVIDVIAQTVRAAAAEFDIVFTSGGVGPTHDDLTIAGIAAAFERPVVEHPKLRAAIERVAGANPGQAMLKMAEVPEGSELVGEEADFFPTVHIANVFVLPGIPEIFEAKVRALGGRFRSSPYHLRQVYVSAYETAIAEHLDATLTAFPELLLGSYPKLSDPEYKVRLTLESKNESYLERALADLVGRMPPGFIVKIER
jgi:molybdenum cofactor synthesis domain-containing protein